MRKRRWPKVLLVGVGGVTSTALAVMRTVATGGAPLAVGLAVRLRRARHRGGWLRAGGAPDPAALRQTGPVSVCRPGGTSLNGLTRSPRDTQRRPPRAQLSRAWDCFVEELWVAQEPVPLTSDRPLRIKALQAVHRFNDADDRAVYELAGQRRWVGGVLLDRLDPSGSKAL